MRIFIGFDDTDNKEAEYGTGKLARWFEQVLPEGCVLWGVLRRQLLVYPDIPFIEFNQLRQCPNPMRVRDLEQMGIRVISHDRDAKVPGPDDPVHTRGWLRPRLLGGRPVLIVQEQAKGVWESLGKKRQVFKYAPDIV